METAIPVQPAGQPATPAAPIVQLKMFVVADPTFGSVAVQGVCLVDDQGRAATPMSEITGRKIVKLLDRLCQFAAAQGGQLYSPEDTGPDAG